MSRIRLRYTGLIAFSTRILSLFTGLIFTVTVTRRLPYEDFGLYGILFAYLNYFIFPVRAVMFWITRYTARGFNVAKTGIFVNTGLSFLSLFAYLLLAPHLAASVGADISYFLLWGSQVLLISVIASLEAVAYGTEPQIQSYGFIIAELVRVVFGVFIVALLRFGLSGVITAIIFSQLFQLLFLLYLLRDRIKGSLNLDMAKKWFKLFWIPIYGLVGDTILSLDVIIISAVTGSTLPMAYMKAPMTVVNIITYSSFLAYALYPKMLGGGDSRDVETVLKMTLLFAVPLMVGGFILARPLLAVLNIGYAVTENILRVGAIAALPSLVSNVFGAVIGGTERVELREDATFRDYVKSKIFLLPTLSYIKASFFLPFVFLLTQYSVSEGLSYVSLIFYYVLVGTLLHTPFMIYTWLLAKRVMNFKFPWASLARYLIAASVMAIYLTLFYPSEAYSERIWYVVSGLLPVTAAGALIYLSLAYIIDKDAKSLVNSTFTYLKKALKF